MNLLQRLRTLDGARANPISFQGYVNEVFGYNGTKYALMGSQTLTGNTEAIEGDFSGLIRGAYKANGVVFACMVARASVFSAARFQFQQYAGGQPGNLFGTPELAILERPWPNGTTQDLLGRMSMHADLAGNAYVTRRANGTLKVLRPDWVDILLGSDADPEIPLDSGDIDADVIGYVYFPGGKHDRKGRPPVILPRDLVAHFAPYPDPAATYRGVSWLSSVLSEIDSDQATTAHKSLFLSQGATPNLVVQFPQGLGKDKLDTIKKMLQEDNEGLANAYKTLYLTGGADAKVVGSSLQEMDFSKVQGAGEVRIAVAAGVPATVLGLSEGLAGSSLNAGNFGQARRNFADRTIDHLWKNAAGSLETLVRLPNAGSRLAIDTRYVPFLREDQKDQAEIQQAEATAINTLVTAGFDPTSVVQAVTAGDLALLKHSGLVSVQLLPPGQTAPAATNGSAPAAGGRAVVTMTPGMLRTPVAELLETLRR